MLLCAMRVAVNLNARCAITRGRRSAHPSCVLVTGIWRFLTEDEAVACWRERVRAGSVRGKWPQRLRRQAPQRRDESEATRSQ
eukprot:scaffold69855_cov27-Tisochrysis_lutea.AAC.3